MGAEWCWDGIETKSGFPQLEKFGEVQARAISGAIGVHSFFS